MAPTASELAPDPLQRCSSGPPSLPAEIIKLIACHLRDDRQALHACLLVSWAWSQAAVEYLYKAVHMMGVNDLKSFTDVTEIPSLLQGLSLDERGEGEPQRGSARPQSNPSSEAMSPTSPVVPSRPLMMPRMGTSTADTLPTQAMARRLLWRTIESSLLNSDKCSYDYIYHLDKISSVWLAGLIQDWAAFCRDWRGHRSLLHAPTLCVSDSAATEPSLARQEHCFNRLLCKVSKRCRSVDEFQSSALVQPTTLIYAIRHLRNLTWMDLKDSQELSDDIFNALADNVRFLSYLRLSGSKMRDVTTKAVADLILAQNKDTLSQFKVIHGNNIFEDTSILKAIGQRHGHSMQRLTLAVCDLEDSGLQEYGPLCQGLLSINLEYSSGVTDDILLPILDACNQLVKLDLTETDCTQATIQGLSTIADSMVLPSPSSRPRSRFASMRRLILNNIDSPFTTNLFLPLADACPELEELHMNSILADSFQDFSQFISKMKRLLDLDIGNVFPEFSDSNLISLVDALPGLRWLSVANTQITNVSLVYLAEKSYALCDLCILGCDQVTKTGLLEFLDKIINKTGFKRLDITYCRLDDGAVAEIRERAKHMAIENGTTGTMEIEGDDQFADNVVDDDVEREEAEESEDEEAEETDDSDDDNSLDELFEAAETAEEMADALHDIDTSSSVIDLESLLGSFVSDTSSTLHSDEEVMSNYSDISDLEADDYGQ